MHDPALDLLTPPAELDVPPHLKSDLDAALNAHEGRPGRRRWLAPIAAAAAVTVGVVGFRVMTSDWTAQPASPVATSSGSPSGVPDVAHAWSGLMYEAGKPTTRSQALSWCRATIARPDTTPGGTSTHWKGWAGPTPIVVTLPGAHTWVLGSASTSFACDHGGTTMSVGPVGFEAFLSSPVLEVDRATARTDRFWAVSRMPPGATSVDVLYGTSRHRATVVKGWWYVTFTAARPLASRDPLVDVVVTGGSHAGHHRGGLEGEV